MKMHAVLLVVVVLLVSACSTTPKKIAGTPTVDRARQTFERDLRWNLALGSDFASNLSRVAVDNAYDPNKSAKENLANALKCEVVRDVFARRLQEFYPDLSSELARALVDEIAALLIAEVTSDAFSQQEAQMYISVFLKHAKIADY